MILMIQALLRGMPTAIAIVETNRKSITDSSTGSKAMPSWHMQ